MYTYIYHNIINRGSNGRGSNNGDDAVVAWWWLWQSSPKLVSIYCVVQRRS